MSGTQHGRAATIYQFPKGGRGGMALNGDYSAVVVPPVRFSPPIMVDGGWYHDEAVREDAEHRAGDSKPN